MNPITAWRLLPLSITIALLLLPLHASAQITINELMFAPIAPEPEWIEIHNSSTVAITLDGWRLEDASGSACRIESCRLAAGAYLVLTEDTAAFRARRIGAGALLRLDLPTLNNDADRLVLRDAAGNTIDTIRYASSWSTIPQSSLERRASSSIGTVAQSWGSSRDTNGATPGRRNSLTPPGIDVAIDSVRFEPTGRRVIVSIRNAGTTGDEVEGNDMAGIELPIGSAGVGVIINEIMFDPVVIDEESSAEYIELLNIGDEPIEVAGWRLYDRSERAQATIPLSTEAIPSGGYLLVASDSSIYEAFPALRDSTNVVTINRSSFSLNLEEDDVRLRDGSGHTIDSLTYRSDWHWSELAGTRGISLERISSSGASTDRRNWSSSVAPSGGTPAARNSRSLEIRATESTLAITPDILSPDNDGHEDFTRISWNLPRAASIITIALYDRHGRRITRIVDNEPAAAIGETIWNGLDGRGEPVSPGIYLVILEAGGSVSARGKVIVVGR
jgi:hypothetical protein